MLPATNIFWRVLELHPIGRGCLTDQKRNWTLEL